MNKYQIPSKEEYKQISSELRKKYSVNVRTLKAGGFSVAKGGGALFSGAEHESIYLYLEGLGFSCPYLTKSLTNHGGDIVHSAGHATCGVRWLKKVS